MLQTPGASAPPGPVRTAKRSSTDNLESVRPYRSRKDRPCDRCRRRKQRCIVFDKTEKCLHCNLSSAECTYNAKDTSKASQASSSSSATQIKRQAVPPSSAKPSLSAETSFDSPNGREAKSVKAHVSPLPSSLSPSAYEVGLLSQTSRFID
jgi:hypothetical protein